MPFGLESLAEARQVEIDRAIEEAKKAKNSSESLQILLGSIRDLRDDVSNIALEKVTVENFDEVRAALRNELNRLSKPLIDAIKKLGLSSDRITAAVKDVKIQNMAAFEPGDDIQIIRRPRENLTIKNLSDIQFPGDIKVNNLEDLERYFNRLSTDLTKAFKVPAPKVTVNPPDVNVPEIKIPEIRVPDIQMPDATKNLAPLLDAIKNLKDTIRRTSANQGKQMAAFSQGLNESSARKAFKQSLDARGVGNFPISTGTAGAKALTDNTAGVALAADTTCSYVDITAYGGIISIGDSTSTRVDASANGIVLTPGSTMYRVVATNLNQVFASGATGSRACFIYYV